MVQLEHGRPFDSRATIAWLRARAVAGVEHADGDTYARTLRLGTGHAVVHLQPSVDAASIALRAWLSDDGDIDDAVRRCRALFDLDADSVLIDRDLRVDQGLAALVAARPGLHVPGAVDGFELAVRAVLGQQVSVAAARTFARRLTQQFGTRVDNEHPQLTHLFPAPHDLLDAPVESIGITAHRAATLRSLARAVVDGRLSLARDRTVSSESMQHLRALPGVGEWTAGYIAMRALGDPDVLLAGDLGLLRAARGLGLPDTRRDLLEHSMRWRPWRSYATMHLWAAQG